jgi:hypothetical protein
MSEPNAYMAADAVREATEGWLDKNRALIERTMAEAIEHAVRQWLMGPGAAVVRDGVKNAVRQNARTGW